MFCSLLISLCCLSDSVVSLEFYVSTTNGDDYRSGLDQSNAFKTLQRAQEAIRGIKLKEDDITVNIENGIYEESLYFTDNDSGRENAYIRYTSYPKNNKLVTITGGKQIDLSSFYSCNSPFASNSNLQLLCTNLSSAGITDIGSMETGDLHNCQHNKLELYYNSEPQILARWPDINYDTQLFQFTTITKGLNKTSFIYDDINGIGNSKYWSSEKDPWLHGYWNEDWADQYAKIDGIVYLGNNSMGITSTNLNAPRINARFYAVNMLSELDTKTEYYVDKESFILYWYPPNKKQNLQNNIFVSVKPYVISLSNNASYLSFEDISISYSRISGVYSEDESNSSVRNINITNCIIDNHGNNGVDMTGTNLLIENNIVQYIGCRGLSVFGGNYFTLTPGNNMVKNNTIWNYARWKRTYMPGIYWNGVGNTYSYNNITFGPHNGILGGGNENPGSLGGCNNIFEYNYISNTTFEVSNAGAFYTCGQNEQGWINRGNILRHNIIENIRNLVPITLGTTNIQAVYLDDQISGWYMENNTIINCNNGLFIGGGRRNVVINNYCYDVDLCVHLDNRGMGNEASSCNNSNTSSLWLGLYSVNYQKPPWSIAYPEMVNIGAQQPCVPVFNDIQNNEYCGNNTHFADFTPQNAAAWNDTDKNNTYKCH